MLISDGEAWISAGLFLLVSVNSVSSEGKISQLKLFGILIVPCLRPERDKCSISLVLSEERTHFWLEQPFLAGYHWFDTHPSNDWLRVISRGGVCATRSNKVLASFYLHFGKLAECRKMRMNVAVWECVCVCSSLGWAQEEGWNPDWWDGMCLWTVGWWRFPTHSLSLAQRLPTRKPRSGALKSS